MSSGSDGRVSDAPRGNWVDAYAPPATRPYLRMMRADRPIGTWLLLIPCWWGAALAAGAAGMAMPNLWHLALFALGAFVMRGAGCVWNDVTDRDIDAQVARTRSRPIPSGQVSVPQALAFMVALALIGLAVLVQFNTATILIGIASLAVVGAYPFMKRVTHFPQVVLGFAFNWGCLVGWTAVHGELSLAPILLYLAGVAWTLGYDTIYALQDLEDDALVGVKSTARFFGQHVRTAIVVFYAASILLLGAALIAAGSAIPAFLGLLVFALMTGRIVARLDERNPASALIAFRKNRDSGLALFAGLAADCLVRSGALG
jgi:4-hydroxybenzoate polyprenyltransferase